MDKHYFYILTICSPDINLYRGGDLYNHHSDRITISGEKPFPSLMSAKMIYDSLFQEAVRQLNRKVSGIVCKEECTTLYYQLEEIIALSKKEGEN